MYSGLGTVLSPQPSVPGALPGEPGGATCVPDEQWTGLPACKNWFNTLPTACRDKRLVLAGGMGMDPQVVSMCKPFLQKAPSDACIGAFIVGTSGHPGAMERLMALPSCSGQQRPTQPQPTVQPTPGGGGVPPLPNVGIDPNLNVLPSCVPDVMFDALPACEKWYNALPPEAKKPPATALDLQILAGHYASGPNAYCGWYAAARHLAPPTRLQQLMQLPSCSGRRRPASSGGDGKSMLPLLLVAAGGAAVVAYLVTR